MKIKRRFALSEVEGRASTSLGTNGFQGPAL